MSSFKEIKKILKKHRIFPSKRLGQNFLIGKGVLKKIVEAAELSKNDFIFEIGPGMGNLTIELAKKVKKVLAIEKDKKMVQILEKILKEKGIENVDIVNADVLKFLNRKGLILNKKYKVVANIPYYLTSRLLRKILEDVRVKPLLMVMMVQKEVAQRIVAQPPKMNLLAISVQFYARPEIISYVSKNSFWPKPKVDSAIIRLRPKKDKCKVDIDRFFEIVKAGFAHPRKQLVNNLSEGLAIEKEFVKKWLRENHFSPKQRAENLSLNDWKKLIKTFKIK